MHVVRKVAIHYVIFLRFLKYAHYDDVQQSVIASHYVIILQFTKVAASDIDVTEHS